MMDSLRAGWRKLRHGTPGRRFVDFHDDRQERRASGGGMGRGAAIGIGILLLVGGLAIGWLPGPGGFIAIFGVALLATEYRPLARLLDHTEMLLRRGWRWIRARWERSSLAVKVAAVVCITSVAAAFVYAAGTLLLG